MVEKIKYLDEKTEFRVVELVTGEKLKGRFKFRRMHGDLGYAGVVVLVEEGKGLVIPLSSVKIVRVDDLENKD